MPYRPAGRFKWSVCNTRRNWYTMPRTPYARGNPMANKRPEEYPTSANYGFTKMGLDWCEKVQRRGRFHKWPGVGWNDDPLNRNAPVVNYSFSAKQHNPLLGEPKWNMYVTDHQDFRMNEKTYVTNLGSVLKVYVGSVWGSAKVASWLDIISKQYKTVQDVVALGPDFDNSFPADVIPKNFLRHVSLLSHAIIEQTEIKRNRLQLHKQGVLRTLEGERYFALPFMVAGPAWPQKLQQPGDRPPEYSAAILVNHKIHPVFTVDHAKTVGMVP
eukprot:PhF_6_TR1589/c0_g1_i1/m.2882